MDIFVEANMFQGKKQVKEVEKSLGVVADLDHFDTDPDPTFHFDPDPTFHCDTALEPTFQFGMVQIRI